MRNPSVHGLLVSQLRQTLEGRAIVLDASASGTEEILLLLEVKPCHKVKSGPERLMLHLLLISPSPLFWLQSISRKRPLAGGGFGDWLRTHIRGARIEGVSAGQSGRILRLDLISGPNTDKRRMTLVLDPLSNASRLLVLDHDGKVEQRFPPPIHKSPSGRGLPGHTYEEPGSGFRELWTRLADQEGDGSTARSKPEGDGSTARSKLVKELPGGGQIWVCLAESRDRPQEIEGSSTLFLSPLPCGQLASERKDTASSTARTLSGPWYPLEAAREIGILQIGVQRQLQAIRQARQTLRAEKNHLRKLWTRVTAETEEARQGEHLRRQAEALLVHGTRVPKGASEVALDDPSAPGETIEVSLDPARGFAENAARLFAKAGRMERALALREVKLEQIAMLLEQIDGWLQRLERSEDPADISPVRRSLAEAEGLERDLEPGLRRRWNLLLRRLRGAAASLDAPLDRVGYEARRARGTDRRDSRTGKRRDTMRVRKASQAGQTAAPADAALAGGSPMNVASERAGIHPRRYELPAGWVVLVGRSNRENDILTHKVARQRDLWFHARGVSGSHVILQRGTQKHNPSKEILVLAAGIAAYFSKSRTSGMAPVVYTERRYVRKPRKAPPGLAVCLREKVLIVRPKLPPEPKQLP
ncbi:MAG: DUF814 domain-containing protein [Candidatus Eisenbacteria sp.]|nr:DUF814 domain-containing protein [Candidatus Eisenbacteria bacterium]